jgi:hypothetical protein
MFSGPRFVIVDDKKEHLESIVGALRKLGAHGLGVIYSPEAELNASDFSGVRGLFLDLQLTDNLAVTDWGRHYASIQTILEDNIAPFGGPFLVILWTSAPDRALELEDYLHKGIDKEHAYARPLAVLPLSKTDYIELANGSLKEGVDLVAAVRDKLSERPALASAVQWEHEVLNSAGAVVRHLFDDIVVALEPEARSEAMGNLLRRAAIEAVGLPNLRGSERLAVHSALLPLLTDEILNSSVDDATKHQWSDSFNDAQKQLPTLSSREAAKLNSRLHIAHSLSGQLRADDWGALTAIPNNFSWWSVGFSSKESWLAKHTPWANMSEDAKKNTRVFKLRVGASCDYAQKRRAPIPYVLAAAVPVKADGKLHKLPSTSNSWVSPLLLLDEHVVQLVVDPSMTMFMPPSLARLEKAKLRLKEQLLVELVHAISTYSARPGIMQFRS